MVSLFLKIAFHVSFLYLNVACFSVFLALAKLVPDSILIKNE